LQPFDATLGEPRIEIVNPTNGDNYREGQDIELELLMSNVVEATLNFDVGGDEADARNPETINLTRNETDPDRLTLKTQIPTTDENVVVILRMESGGLLSRAFINVQRDTGIDEVANVVITPSEVVLGGTSIHVEADAPNDMVDFNPSSAISIIDPELSDNQIDLPMSMVNELVDINELSGQLLVNKYL
jgi:hypothetical protein